MGTIAWFAQNRVAANLVMALMVAGGIIAASTVKQEVFPEFSLDLITVSVVYRGAAPAEVEEAICVRIEEQIQDLEGVRRLTSSASDGLALIQIELELGSDTRAILDDVKSRIDAIDTFPEEADEPLIREVTNRRQVIDVALAGELDEADLRRLAETVRDEITALSGVTHAELANARPYEISIEVAERALRRHGLTFDEVAQAIRRSSFDLPGGSVKTVGGEILLRTKGQAYRAEEFERLVLRTRPDGSRLVLGDVAQVIDGFAETDQFSRFEGRPAMLVNVFRTGEQDALHVAGSVRDYIERKRPHLPEGVTLTTWNDASRILADRRDLLLRNGAGGMLLVVLTLALFLRFRLAFWVALGMLSSFLFAIGLMPWLDVSINLISLFAFILVLGILVDDGIVVAENIHTRQRQLGDPLRGAIEGAQEVSLPVVFAVLTTIAAFVPLLDVPGATGKVMRVIPLIVIPCLFGSLIESLWVLPAHLSHAHPKAVASGGWHFFRRLQTAFARGLERFIERVYEPSLEFGLRWRYLTLAVGLSTLLLTLGLVGGGWVRFVFFPDVESDFVSAALTLPQGTPVEATSAGVRQLEEGAERVRRELAERHDGVDQFRFMFAAIGEQPFRRAQSQNAGGAQERVTSAHLGELTIELLPAEERTVSSAEIAAAWREATGAIPDALELGYTASLFSPGEDINVQLSGTDLTELRAAADRLKAQLADYAGVYEIADSFLPGKEEITLGIRPSAEVAGLTLSDLGRQVRQAFYGEEAQRLQRGRDDLRVMVRYPESERRSLADLEGMRIRTADGGELPFSEVATVELDRGYSTIRRVDRHRAINVTASVDPAQATAGDIVADVRSRLLPQLLAEHPGLRYSFEGQQAEQRDTLGGLGRGFAFALLMIYALLAIPLRSYVQPLIIMAAIPFGFVGAVWGHMLMGMDLTVLSMFGLVALTGVVVNDSLVMVDFINRHRATRSELVAAVRQAGSVRFRPILLTSLTTFAGLSPLIMERSMQARFLVPMAVSLAFGVVFATFITLVLVPAAYLVVEDIKAWGRRDPA